MNCQQKPLEASMSYPMIVIRSCAGDLAAAIYSAVAHGLRILFAPARAGEVRQNLFAAPVRSRVS